MIASAFKVLGGISIGVGIGTQWARVELDRYYRAKGEEFVSQQYRAMQAAWTDRQEAETPAKTEADLDHEKLDKVLDVLQEVAPALMDQADLSPDAIKVGGTATLEMAEYNAQAAQYAMPDMLEGISYITEDDYNEEDGNAKEQITIHLGGEEPIFIHGDVAISNWEELIGDTILVDFFRKFQPHDTERVLYVRNHRRGEDFEVWQAIP